MKTQQTQIKINLSLKLKDYVEGKASQFGMPLAGYIKHLILKDVEHMDFPVYQASQKTEHAYQKAIKEKDKAIPVKGDIGKFLDRL